MANSGVQYQSGGHGHHAGMWVFPQAEQVTADVSGKTAALPSGYKLALAAAGILTVLGVLGFIIKLSSGGFAAPGPWGYYAGAFSFIFMVTGAAPLAACAFRFTKSHWRRPVSRVAELFAVIGVVNIILFIPLMLAMPPIYNPEAEGLGGTDALRQERALGNAAECCLPGSTDLEVRRTLWFEAPFGAPHLWDFLGLVGLAVCGMALLRLSARPDLAQAYYAATGWRRTFYGLISGGWYGTKKQWNAQKAGLALLGAWYFMLLIFVQFIFVTDYAMSMVPGWKDSVLPPMYTVMSFQSALSLILVVLFVMRRKGGYAGYIGKAPFWSASKILLGLTLLWTYHLFAFFITYWYGRLEHEENIIRYVFTQPYLTLFLGNFVFSFVAPFLTLIWNPVRRSDWGPTLAGGFALVGALLFNLRTFNAAFNTGEHFEFALTRVPAAVWPGLTDVFLILGGLGLVALIYLLAAKVVPLMSIWEVKEGAKYQKMDTLVKGEYLVLAKPE